MPEKTELVAKKENSLAITVDFDVSLLDEISGSLAEELDGMKAEFDRVKVPAGGGIVFEIPGEDPDNPETSKELIGVIVDKYPVNAYWEDIYSGQNNPPDCSAIDGKYGLGKPGGNCEICKHNQWGSAAKGKGKACKNLFRIFILREGEALPLRFAIPPTSIRNFSNFMVKRVIGKGLRGTQIITKITLKSVPNADGIRYSQALFQVAGKLSKETADKLKACSERMKPMTREVPVNTAEYIDAEDDDNLPI